MPAWASPVGWHDPGGIFRGGDLEPAFAQEGIVLGVVEGLSPWEG